MRGLAGSARLGSVLAADAGPSRLRMGAKCRRVGLWRGGGYAGVVPSLQVRGGRLWGMGQGECGGTVGGRW